MRPQSAVEDDNLAGSRPRPCAVEQGREFGIGTDPGRQPAGSVRDSSLDGSVRDVSGGGDLCGAQRFEASQDKNLAMAWSEATQQSVEPPQDVARLDLRALRVPRLFRTPRQSCERALTFPPPQRGFEPVIGDPMDEAAQLVGCAEGCDFLKHTTENILRKVLRVGHRSEGASGGPEDHRRETLPHLGDCPVLVRDESACEISVGGAHASPDPRRPDIGLRSWHSRRLAHTPGREVIGSFVHGAPR
jgi:hypothetical protein